MASSWCRPSSGSSARCRGSRCSPCPSPVCSPTAPSATTATAARRHRRSWNGSGPQHLDEVGALVHDECRDALATPRAGDPRLFTSACRRTRSHAATSARRSGASGAPRAPTAASERRTGRCPGIAATIRDAMTGRQPARDHRRGPTDPAADRRSRRQRAQAARRRRVALRAATARSVDDLPRPPGRTVASRHRGEGQRRQVDAAQRAGRREGRPDGRPGEPASSRSIATATCTG